MTFHFSDLTMNMNTGTVLQSVQEFLASKVSTLISAFAAGVGIASIAGWVSLGAALLSFIWMAVQIFNYATFTYPKNVRDRRRRELEEAEEERVREVSSGNSVCSSRY